MYYYDEINEAYQDCVISKNGKLRETTDLEKMLIEWSWKRMSQKGPFESIRYADFEYEPYQEKWFDEAEKEFAKYFRATHHRHTELEKKIASAIGLSVGTAQNALKKRKAVRNSDTGEVFRSMAEACRAYGIDKSNFSKSIKMHWRIGGYHWEYVNEEDAA